MDYIFKNALEFLVFAYWGISFDDDIGTILEKIVRKAYKDASGQGAFNALIGENDTDLRKNADSAKKEAIEEVIAAIRKPDTYQNWHNQLCERICEIFRKYDVKKSDVYIWSYGNSQKIVNMSVKYVVLLSSIFNKLDKRNEAQEELCEIGQFFTKNISDLDIPVDSFIIEALWEENAKTPYATIQIIKEKIKKDGTLGVYSSGKYKSWSKWDQGEYETFEKSLKDYVKNQIEFENPFDWEGHAWIEIAKKRRKKDGSDKDQE